MMTRWLQFSLLILSFTTYHIIGAEDQDPVGDVGDDRHIVLVISLDGFSHQYLQKYKLENLSRIFARGSSTEKFINQFVTKTYPNHFSIATGVFEEVHGVVGNTVYDQSVNKILGIDDEGFFTQNPGIYPIWTLNEAHGGHSGCIMWPGCTATFHGRNLTFFERYKRHADLKESISLAFQWFYDRDTPANLVFIYHEEPDASGHAYGPDSPHIMEALLKVDKALEFLFHKMTLNNLQDNLDIIILSDHGMNAVPESNIIELNGVVDPSLYKIAGSSPVLNIWPEYDQMFDVYRKLQEGSQTLNYSVFKKDELPDDWHYKHNPRLSPIVAIADQGYVFQDFHGTIDFYKNNNWPDLTTNIYGDHGYPVNTSTMEPIFVALGPSFKHKFRAPPFSNLDVYPLLCRMLSLPPGPTNGTLTNITTILSLPFISSLVQPLAIALGCLVGLIGVIGVIACTLAKRDSSRRVSADSLINGYIHRKTMRSGPPLSIDGLNEEEGLLESEVITVDM